MNNHTPQKSMNVVTCPYHNLSWSVSVEGPPVTTLPGMILQMTPASSLWAQLCWPQPLCGQSARLCSLPVQPKLSSQMTPDPAPNSSLSRAIPRTQASQCHYELILSTVLIVMWHTCPPKMLLNAVLLINLHAYTTKSSNVANIPEQDN